MEGGLEGVLMGVLEGVLMGVLEGLLMSKKMRSAILVGEGKKKEGGRKVCGEKKR